MAKRLELEIETATASPSSSLAPTCASVLSSMCSISCLDPSCKYATKDLVPVVALSHLELDEFAELLARATLAQAGRGPNRLQEASSVIRCAVVCVRVGHAVGQHPALACRRSC